ncbi:Uncharacterised protein [Vibrio cholerae]|nr:Uncharacterised protein [Vibrio cholerae]CSI38381.1 Uncharacterised protein [Vibrio cholerae]
MAKCTGSLISLCYIRVISRWICVKHATDSNKRLPLSGQESWRVMALTV